MNETTKAKPSAGATRAAARVYGTGFGMTEAAIPRAAEIIDEETAARDLLAACEAVLAMCNENNEHTPGCYLIGPSEVKAIRAAIAKARGQG